MNHIRLRNLQVHKQGRRICRLEELSIDEGEKVVITGANGAGKTTLLRVLAGLETAKADLLMIPFPLHDRLYLHQLPILFRGTVLFNLHYGLKARGASRRQLDQAMYWLDQLGVSGLAHRAVSTLSGGECRRVALARSFALQPPLLLLDEPFADLDQLGIDGVAHFIETSTSTIVVASPTDLSQSLSGRRIALSPSH